MPLDHTAKKEKHLHRQTNPDSCLTAGQNPWSHGCLNVTTGTLIGRLMVQSAHYMVMSWNTDSGARGSNCQLSICCRCHKRFRQDHLMAHGSDSVHETCTRSNSESSSTDTLKKGGGLIGCHSFKIYCPTFTLHILFSLSSLAHSSSPAPSSCWKHFCTVLILN